MRGVQTMFFIVKDDIAPLIAEWEQALDICYYKIGLFDEEIAQRFDSFFDIPNFGIAKAGDWNKLDFFLIMEKSTKLNVRSVPQRRGGIKYAVNPMVNRVSVIIKLGGILKDGVIVAGTVDTIAQDEVSLMIYKIIASKIKKQCRRIDNFYVSKTAEKYMQEGWRLVTNEKLPTGFDLKM